MRHLRLPCLKPTVKRWRCPVSIGIDLGTSNSAVAVVQQGRARSLPIIQGQYQIPSSVVSTKDGLIPLVEISDKESIKDGCLVCNTKRLIGRSLNSIDDISRFPFHLEEGLAQSIRIRTPFQSLSPEEVSGVILEYLVQSVETQLNQKVDNVVITIPSHFSVAQKSATLTAAGLAGINTVTLLQEPIAAALAHGLGKSTDQELILVLDVGGGTYDVSILSSFEGIMEVIAFSGNHTLGGLDFDHALSKWIQQKIQTKELDPKMRSSLNVLAEQVKQEVIKNGSCKFRFSDVELSLNLDEFGSITDHLSQQLLNPIVEAGKLALIDWGSVDKEGDNEDPYRPPPKRISQVVFAGGSSSLPALHELVQHLTCLWSKKSMIDPKLCVSYGAAVYAGILDGSVSGIEIMDGAYSQDLHNRVTGFV